MNPSTLVEPVLRSASAAPGSPGLAERARTLLDGRPLTITILLSFVGALLLQCWRPYFFLTDDAIADWLPPAVEAYRRLWEGRWPFYNEYVFGGVHVLGDPGVFTLLSPWALLSSFLAKTPYYFALADVLGTLSLITLAAAFCWSALQLRGRFNLPISTVWIVVLSFSYAFTPFNFIVNASWVGFFNAPTALPVIFAAAFEPRWRRALALQTGALLYAMFGGHMHPFTVLILTGSGLLVAVAAIQRRWQPVFVWAAAGTLVLVIASPILVPALMGFGQDRRSAGLPVQWASFQRVPLVPLVESFLFGPLSPASQENDIIDTSDHLYALTIAFSLVNIPLIAALACRRRWNRVELCLLGGLLCTAVNIVRPRWLAEVYAHLPMLRSLRWPFREIATLHFFTHTLFLFIFQPALAGTRRLAALVSASVGLLVYALVFFCAAPTFWLFGVDRRLLTSGEADRYWTELKTSGGLRPDASFIVEAAPALLGPWRPAVPFVVLGGFDHAAMFRVHNVAGFSPSPPPASLHEQMEEIRTKPYFWGGVYNHEAAMNMLATRPGTERIVLTGMAPTRWEVIDGASVRRFFIGPDHLIHALP